MTHFVALASFHDEAPADEYFGPFKVSILEIGNRLNRLESKRDWELADAGTIHGIDAVEVAIEDWQRHYPRDSWLPRYLDRIVHVYVRAHAGRDAHARRAYALLQRHYGRDRHAREARLVARRMLS